MSYEDFIKHFDELNMCHIEPDAIGRSIAQGSVCTYLFYTTISGGRCVEIWAPLCIFE